MWKSVKLHFFVKTKFLDILKAYRFFHRHQNSVLFKNPYSRDCEERFEPKQK